LHDVAIFGAGPAAISCYDVLSSKGLRVSRTLDLDPDDSRPLIVGEAPGAYQAARQAAETGRHVLIASQQPLTSERLTPLLENRRQSQAIFVWSERRYHPGYRLIGGLTETDATWRPRFLRSETLSSEPSNPGVFRLRALEAIGLVVGIAADEPECVAAHASADTKRNSFDLLNLEVTFPDLQAFIQVGLGEAVERRETLLASDSRKAYVDELDLTAPVRLVDNDSAIEAERSERWLSCHSPSSDELVRKQCFAFLDATIKPWLAEEEATLWTRALDVLAAMERSLDANGASVTVEEPEEVPGHYLRLVVPDAAA
jgi:hypothetical protein